MHQPLIVMFHPTRSVKVVFLGEFLLRNYLLLQSIAIVWYWNCTILNHEGQEGQFEKTGWQRVACCVSLDLLRNGVKFSRIQCNWIWCKYMHTYLHTLHDMTLHCLTITCCMHSSSRCLSSSMWMQFKICILPITTRNVVWYKSNIKYNKLKHNTITCIITK